ncbi:MAG: hypothetical protein R3Y54_06945 [Eubacteriales bacterium]
MYRSKYEAYSFLREDPRKSVACDFEILSDEVASKVGHLVSKITEESLQEELVWITEIVYHLNPTLRTFMSVEQEEFQRLLGAMERLKEATKDRYKMFVLPTGSKRGSYAL